MLDALLDAIIDTLKLFPYLFITFIVIELFEHKLAKKTSLILTKSQKYGPFVGGILGGIPQCGFSAMAANLFSNKLITRGTLIAIFLATSDEMIPIMLSEHVSIVFILQIVVFKIIIGIIIGLFCDLICKKSLVKDYSHQIEEHKNCNENIFLESFIHSIKTSLFIFIVCLAVNILFSLVGESVISDIFKSQNILVYIFASIIGLVPNCASSVVLTQLYLSNVTTIGITLSGLLTGSGVGILLLLKNNKAIKENLLIISVLLIVGISVGFLVDLI